MQEQQKKNYLHNDGCLGRRVFFTHFLKNLLQAKKMIEKTQDRFPIDGLPFITPEEQCQNRVHNIISGNQSLIGYDSSDIQIQSTFLIKLLIRQNKYQFLMIFFFTILEVICRISASIILKMLFDIFQHYEETKMDQAYLYVSIISFLWFFAEVAKQNFMIQVMILFSRIRSQIVYFTFRKLLSFSSFVANSQSIGKVINVLITDFNNIQLSFLEFFVGIVSPIPLISIMVLMGIRVGWAGLVPFAIFFIFFLFCYFLTGIQQKVTEKLNELKDCRTKKILQVISGNRMIKMLNWKSYIQKKVSIVRLEQSFQAFKVFALIISSRVVEVITFVWGGIATFMILHYFPKEENILTTSLIFSVLELLSYSTQVFGSLNASLVTMYEVRIALTRFSDILSIKNIRMLHLDDKENEKQTKKIHIEENYDQNNQVRIIFIDFEGFLDILNLGKPTIRDINLCISSKEFIGILGGVGSGKSALLGSILGQTPYCKGRMVVQGKVTFIEQQPKIFSGTIAENVIFGRQYSEERYKAALYRACLNEDIATFEKGDSTIVGENGISLSGGQKVRVALARMLYQQYDIYLFDDPFSSLDSKVISKIYERAIRSLIGKKIIILVTHNQTYLKDCNRVFLMEEGKLNQVKIQKEPSISQISEVLNIQKQKGTTKRGETNQNQDKTVDERPSDGDKNIKLNTQFKTYFQYILSGSYNHILIPAAIILFASSEAGITIFYRLLSDYSNVKQGTSKYFEGYNQYWLVLWMIQLGYLITNQLKFLCLSGIFISSNFQVHKLMTSTLLRCKLSILSKIPFSDIIGRFMNDINILDFQAPYAAIYLFQNLFSILAMIVGVSEMNIYFIIPAILCLVLCFILFNLSAKEIVCSKLLDLQTKSSMYSLTLEALNGLAYIQKFEQKGRFLKSFAEKINNVSRVSIFNSILLRGLGTQIGFVSVILLIVGLFMGLKVVERQNSSLYSISALFLIRLISMFQIYLRFSIALKGLMVSYERAKQVSKLQTEAQQVTEYDKQMKLTCIDSNNLRVENQELQNSQLVIFQNELTSFRDYSIILKNFSLRYSDDLPYVLKDLNIIIKRGQKVGIVGRTGAGKSSFVQGLMRLNEPGQNSQYFIEGFNALKMGIKTLRQGISIIPQSPYFIEGSIKQNLDPKYKYSNQMIWETLQICHIKEVFKKKQIGLQTNIEDCQLSIGQKQLLCLARVLLEKNKLLLLDQASAYVDQETDKMIQKCVKQQFADATVIAIAHRLITIADYDRVIVLKNGEVAEEGTPHNLIEKKGQFSEMVKNSGAYAEKIKKIAQTQHKHKQKEKVGNLKR